MKWNNENDAKPRSGSAASTVTTGEFRRLGVGFGRDNATDEEIDRVDFKMVTFSLAGKDYGIDIMKVKEIARFANFTYVPNTLPFVAGVYNLRGEIISIIDLRVMFNLRSDRTEPGATEDGLILRLDHNVIGVIVDSIDRVVGISSETIQPPHPIFADVNIQYISGVVEHEERLYIILDVDKIFAREEQTTRDVIPVEKPVLLEAVLDHREAEATDSDFDFVVDGLATFRALYAGDINLDWVRERYQAWRTIRSEQQKPVQFSESDDAIEFVRTFPSACTGRLWETSYSDAVAAVVPAADNIVVNAWNPGCGKGFETYSLAAILQDKNPGKRIRVWASDNDLLGISTAPNVVLSPDTIPTHLESYTVDGPNGRMMTSQLRDTIMFEYHDILNQSSVPECHVIMCRDLLSVLPAGDRDRVISKFHDTLSSSGVLIVGDNERLDADARWVRVSDAVNAYRKV